jgi:hypothetical protein
MLSPGDTCLSASCQEQILARNLSSLPFVPCGCAGAIQSARGRANAASPSEKARKETKPLSGRSSRVLVPINFIWGYFGIRVVRSLALRTS